MTMMVNQPAAGDLRTGPSFSVESRSYRIRYFDDPLDMPRPDAPGDPCYEQDQAEAERLAAGLLNEASADRVYADAERNRRRLEQLDEADL